MLLTKTEKARIALASNAAGALSLAQRRILILTDGRRSIEQIMAMLGPQILGDLDLLLRDGYLSTDARAAVRDAGIGQRLRDAAGRIAGATPAPAAAQARVPAHTPATDARMRVANASVGTRAGTRRSLAASKMYVLDLLQTQRDLRIAECRTDIQCAQDEAATVVALLDGVRQLIPLVSAGMSARILARLDDVLPEAYLPALRSLESEITGRPVLAIDNVA